MVIVTDLATEPVDLGIVKRHLNLLFDTTGSYVFTDDDTKLTELITECRKALENYTGLSFGTKTIRVIVRNELGNIRLPWGPIQSITAVVDKNGSSVTDYVAYGLKDKWIVSPCSSYLDITYKAGYTTLPADLVRAMKEEIAYRYRNQGDQVQQYAAQTPGVSEGARKLADPYKQVLCLL